MTDFLLRSTSSSDRVNSATYNTGDRVVIARADAQTNFAVMRRYVYECTAGGGGAVAGTVPVYPTTPGGTVVDGAITWTCREPTTWANAARYADYIANNKMAAGDRLLVSQSHVESLAENVSIIFPGTSLAPCSFLCVDDSIGGSSPTTLATGASIATTGVTTLLIRGAILGYGITLSCGTGAAGTNFSINTTAVIQRWISCDFISPSTAGMQFRINYSGGGWNAGQVILESCRFKVMSTGSRILLCGIVRMNDISFISGGSTPSSLFGLVPSAPLDLYVENADFSMLTSGVHIVAGGSYLGIRMVFRNMRMPSGWSGSLTSSAITTVATYVEAYNIDGGDTNYTIRTADYSGTLINETTVVLTGGASDGVTPLSWKIATTANCTFNGVRFCSPEIHRRVTTVGSPITVSVEILHDSTTNLKDDEVWLDVKYLGSLNSTLGVTAKDDKVNLLTTYSGATGDQATSTATWTTTGLTNPNTQVLSVTFTPQEIGYIIARVYVGKASYTIYVDPKLTVV